MKCVIDEKFVEVIKGLGELLTEARLVFDEDGLSISEMEQANVSMLIAKIPKSAFTEYELETKEVEVEGAKTKKVVAEEVGVKLEDLKKVLVRVKLTKQGIKLETVNGRFQVSSGKVYGLPIVEIESKIPDLPALEFKADISLKLPKFIEAIEDAAVVSESMLFTVDKGFFKVSADAETLQNYADNVCGVAGIDPSLKIMSKYSVPYLQKICKFLKAGSEDLVVKLNNDYPLVIESKEEGEVVLKALLAPRVDND